MKRYVPANFQSRRSRKKEELNRSRARHTLSPKSSSESLAALFVDTSALTLEEQDVLPASPSGLDEESMRKWEKNRKLDHQDVLRCWIKCQTFLTLIERSFFTPLEADQDCHISDHTGVGAHAGRSHNTISSNPSFTSSASSAAYSGDTHSEKSKVVCSKSASQLYVSRLFGTRYLKGASNSKVTTGDDTVGIPYESMVQRYSVAQVDIETEWDKLYEDYRRALHS